MPYKITYLDYIKILKFYSLDTPKSKDDVKKLAEDILAKKLCSCIKKLGGSENEARAIGICSRTVFNRKGLSRGKFNCKNGRHVSFKKISNLKINKKTLKKR